MQDTLLLNDRWISYADIKQGNISAASVFEEATLDFCRQWLNEQSSFNLKTSGSTGTPKVIEVTRQQMVASAKQTIDFFKLSSVDTVLVCLNTAYIAGIMMLVRAFESGARIIAVEPTSNPLHTLDENFDFIAVVPLQLSEILTDESAKIKLEACRAIIVGGAPVGLPLQSIINESSAAIWATFGMTETLTHFALKKINPESEEFYTVLNNTKIRLDKRQCLVVQSPVTQNEEVFTNDLADLITPSQFVWLGRADNVINTGGVKVQVEELEKTMSEIFHKLGLSLNFFISGVNDPKLGEKLCLIIESDILPKQIESFKWEDFYSNYEKPRRIEHIPRFVYTPTGKINRGATMQLINLWT